MNMHDYQNEMGEDSSRSLFSITTRQRIEQLQSSENTRLESFLVFNPLTPMQGPYVSSRTHK
jgi:hypothetical protein